MALSKDATDVWKSLGNPGWDSEELAPYFQKSFTLTLPPKAVGDYLGLDYLKSTEYKGQGGPIQCSYSDNITDPVGKAWIDAFGTFGYALSGDPWAENVTGGYASATTVDPTSKTRSYSASTYYALAKQRPNLEVVTGVQIEKIEFTHRDGKAIAIGLKGLKAGAPVSYHVRKEVILAAGALNSPKILELSGVGNPDILKKHGIKMVFDNPHVGENFQDHPQCGWSFEVKDGIETLDDLNRKDPKAIQRAMEAYQKDQKGPFSRGAVNNHAILPVMDFVTGKNGSEEFNDVLSTHLKSKSDSVHRYLPEKVVDFVQKVLASDDTGSMNYIIYAAQGNFGSDSSEARNVANATVDGNFVTISGFLCYPLSRGSVHIRSADAADMPLIDPNFLSHPLDLDIYARHVRFIEKIATSEPFAKVLKPHGRRHPSFAPQGGDLNGVKEYLRRTTISAWHPCGTCAMRPFEEGGVVDPKLKVYGTDNVRVVDASMVPLICRGNTQSLVYAVAERAADLIKADWGM